MLKVSGLSVSYGGLHALADVSLEVGEGEFVTIVGPNGAGKTTLLKAIGGGVVPAGGRIEYRGENIAGRPSRARATAARRCSRRGTRSARRPAPRHRRWP